MSYDPRELFRDTAWYYARYRPGYPAALFDELVRSYRLDGGTRVVDAGTGTGQIALPLAALGISVTAIDPEPEMLREGRAAAEAAGVGARIVWRNGRAEDLPELSTAPVRLVAFGASFHWMERDRVIGHCDRLVDREGGVALISGGAATKLDGYKSARFEGGPPAWAEVVTATIEEFLGPKRRAGSGFYSHPAERYEQILARSPFSRVVPFCERVEVARSAEQVIGLQLSTSYCSPALLGERTEEFARVLRERLLRVHPDDRFVEEHRLEALLAFRP